MQVRPIFVTATGTGVGKTHATLALLKAFARHGIWVGACKPVETGVVSMPEDAGKLLRETRRLNPRFEGIAPEDLCAYTFPLPAAPFCADRDQSIVPEVIHRKVDELAARCTLLIVEGAGGLMVPLTRDYLMIDLIRDLQAHVLLVTPSRLGCINDTLLSLETLRQRKIPHDWCVNLYEDADTFPTVTRPYYDAVYPDWWSLQEGLDCFVDRYLAGE